MTVQGWWLEVWSVGEGSERIYCGIARTEDGFAVDVFHGDECIQSDTFTTRFEAAMAVDAARTRYGRLLSPLPVEITTQIVALPN